VGQKHEKFREFRTPFPSRDIRKYPRRMYAGVPQAMAQFVLKIELLSHIMGTTPILEMARAYGLLPRLCLLFRLNTLKGIAKAPALDLSRLNTLRATKTSFLTPKRYDELPRPGERGQGIQTAPCSPRVGRVFILCLRKKMETTVEPAQPLLHKGPPLCNGHFFHSGGRSLLF